MKNLAFFLASAVAVLLCTFPAGAESIELGEGAVRAEIEVTMGERFNLTLNGKGWHLSGYDSSVLGFVSRETTGESEETEKAAGRGYTEFVFYPFRKGTGHLLFTRRGTGTYVFVDVVGHEADGKSEAETEVETVGENAADAPDEATAPLPPPSAAVELVPEPVPPSAPKAEPNVEGPSVPLAEPAPLPDAAPEIISGEPQTAHPSGSGEPAEAKGARAKRGEGVRSRSESGTREQNGGMYYTDKQDRVVGVPYKNEEDSYRRGSQLFQKGSGDKALDEYLRYLAECERCVHREEAHYRVAELYVKQGRDADALAQLDTLLRASSSDLRLKAYLMRADIDLRSGDTKRAIEGYSAAWNIDARNKELPRKIADLYYAVREFDSALPLYEKSIESGSADDEVYFRAATICDGEGKARNLEKAYGYYKTLIERFESSSHVEYARKRVQFLEKNFYNFR